MVPKFGFKKPEKEKNQEELDSVKDLQQTAAEKAQLCLHSKPFKEVLEGYAKAERATIDVLLRITKEEHDPLKFGYAAKDLLHNLAHLKAMIDVVHRGAGEAYDDA